MKRRIYILLIPAFVFLQLQTSAQMTINVSNKGAYRAYYTISYTNYGRNSSISETTIDAGGNQSKTVPSGSTNIALKLRYAAFIGVIKDLKTINAGRSGGTVTFKGDLAFTGVSADWEPDDNISGVGEESAVNIDAIYPNGDAELHRTARDANATQMQILIDKATSRVNTKNTRGFTPLHECVQRGFPEGIDILLKAGADMSIQNAMGETPFVMALGLAKKDLLQKFITHGYPVATYAKALESGVKKRNEEMVKLLLDNGADANTAMNISLQQNNIPMVEMILNNYAPPVTIDLYKKLVGARRFDVAKRIVEADIDASQAMDYAILKNVPELVQAAMEKGGDAQKGFKIRHCTAQTGTGNICCYKL